MDQMAANVDGYEMQIPVVRGLVCTYEVHK